MVTNIIYKDQKLPVRISYYALKHFQEDTKKSIEEIDDDFSLIEVLFYHALVAGHKAEELEMTIEREQCEFILDECLEQFMSAVGNFSTGQEVEQEQVKEKQK